MIKFDYLQPKSLEEASKMLMQNDAVPFSGGSDIITLIKDNIVQPKNVVNLKNIGGLDKIIYDDLGGLQIGALVKIADIETNKIIKDKYQILSEAAGEIASPQLRNMGTLGGNLCQRPRCGYYREKDFNCLRKGGDVCFAFTGHNKFHCITGGGPCFIIYPSDMAVALLALDAKVNIFSNGKTKSVPINDFYIVPEDDYTKENILQPGEIVTGVTVPPLQANTISRYIKFKERGVWDFAVVSVGAVFNKNGSSIKNGSFAFGGVAPKPWKDDKLNSSFKNLIINEENINKAAEQAFTDAEPLEMNGYKIILARNLVKKLFHESSVEDKR